MDPGDSPFLFLVIYATVAIGVSFLCSIAEAVLLSISPSYIETLKQTRPRLAARLENLKSTVDQHLAAILTLNTVAHTAGATGVGAEAAAIWGSGAVGIASAVMTLLILILSEIIPKTIGAVYWRGLAPSLARFLPSLTTALYPFVWLSEKITRLIASGEPTIVTREEVQA